MELDETVNPPLETILRFEDAHLENEVGDSYRVHLELHFRSFVSWEPYQALEQVIARILEGKNCFSVPADSQACYSLVSEVRDTTGEALLRPFKASLDKGFTVNGYSVELRPRPVLEIELPEHPSARDEPHQRCWGRGFAFSDLGFPKSAIELARYETLGRPLERATTQAHTYAITAGGASGRFLVLPGENSRSADMMRKLVNSQLPEPLPPPVWSSFPDNCLSLPAGTFVDIGSLGQAYGGLCSLLRAVTGHTPMGVSILVPTAAGRAEARYSLFRSEEKELEQAFETIPFSNSALSLSPLLADCWPRVEHLMNAGFNFGSVAGWYHRGKILNPVEQGLLNLFVFLESLKAHWLSLRDGVAMEDLATDFAGNVNRTLKEILGQRRKVNSLTEYRNRMVHQGVSQLPRKELIEKYWELYRLCSAALLSLIGWTAEWHAPFESRMKMQKAYWTVPDLPTLLPGSDSEPSARGEGA